MNFHWRSTHKELVRLKAERETARRIGVSFLAALGSEKAQAICAREKIAVRAAGEGANSTGGFTVAEEIETAIAAYRELAGVIRGGADIRKMNSDVLNVPRSVRAATASFVGENQPGTELDVEIGNIGLRAKKAMALVRTSSELPDDALVDFGSSVIVDFGSAFASIEDACGWLGDGSGQFGGMTGVLTILANSTLAGSVLAAAGHDAISKLDGKDIGELVARLPEQHLGDARFYCSAAGVGALVALGATVFGIAPTPNGTRPRFQFGGFEVVPCPKLPGRGSQSGKAVIVFGDMHAGVVLGERRGILVKTSTHRHFERDQVAVKATQRFEVVPHNLGDTTNAGALVALVAA